MVMEVENDGKWWKMAVFFYEQVYHYYWRGPCLLPWLLGRRVSIVASWIDVRRACTYMCCKLCSKLNSTYLKAVFSTTPGNETSAELCVARWTCRNAHIRYNYIMPLWMNDFYVKMPRWPFPNDLYERTIAMTPWEELVTCPVLSRYSGNQPTNRYPGTPSNRAKTIWAHEPCDFLSKACTSPKNSHRT